jgi:uncharacterized Zn-binding protein involved in type VI secretion
LGAPAIVINDQITGQCPNHMIPNPATGIPQPAGPLPFAAPLTMNLANTVLIDGKPAAVAGSQGMNTPPHVPPLHPSDPFMAPPTQMGQVVMGSATVLFEGKPAASAQSTCTCCVVPGSLVPSVTDVLIG